MGRRVMFYPHEIEMSIFTVVGKRVNILPFRFPH